MASLIRIKDAKRGNLLFFSNPPQVRGRHHMTIKVSADEGMSWPRKWHALIDERFSACSCLTTVDEDKIGLLYEGPSELYFVRIPIKDLIP